MMDDPFRQAAHLFDSLGETRLRSGKNLRTELCLGQDISFWDVVASYLVLYRFPLLFSQNGGYCSLGGRIKYFVRPYRGLAARFRDSVMSYLHRNDAACSTWPQGGDTVLFLGFVPTFYRDVLRPVAESLASNEGIQVVVIGASQNLPVNRHSNKKVVFQSIWEHWSADTENSAKEMSSHLDVLQDVFFNRAQYQKITENVGEKARRFALKRELYWLFWREFKRLIPQLAIAKHILDAHRPALIISADDADQRCKIYSLSARERNIPTLLVQQGLTGREYPEWMFFTQTIVAAMGHTSQADMINQGVQPEKIVLTGSPGFDHLALPEPDLGANIRKSLGLLENQRMILFASQPYYVGVFDTPDIRKDMINALVQVCNSQKHVKLVIKPHPGDNVRDLKQLIDRSCPTTILDRTIDISPFIKACDILVTFFSTTALQAIYAGKPVINLDFPNSGGLSLYSKSGATWIARSTEELAAHIQNLIGEDRDKEIASRETARQRFLTDMVYLPDGQATKRVLKVVRNILQNNYKRFGVEVTN